MIRSNGSFTLDITNCDSLHTTTYCSRVFDCSYSVVASEETLTIILPENENEYKSMYYSPQQIPRPEWFLFTYNYLLVFLPPFWCSCSFGLYFLFLFFGFRTVTLDFCLNGIHNQLNTIQEKGHRDENACLVKVRTTLFNTKLLNHKVVEGYYDAG